MNKSIFKTAVAVAAVAVGLFVGCGGDDNPVGGGSGDLVGDWLLVSREYDGVVEKIPADSKLFYTFTSSNDALVTVFYKDGDFWIESSSDMIGGKYNIKGNRLYLGEGGGWMNYSVSGNTLTLTTFVANCVNDKCDTPSRMSIMFERGSIAETRKSFGNSLRSQNDPYYYSQSKSKANLEKNRRAFDIFKAFSR